MIYTLLKHPDQLQRVREESGIAPPDDRGSHSSRLPIRGVVRTMTQDVEMSGVTLPKGAKVYIHLGSANHDPAMFVNPDELTSTGPTLTNTFLSARFNRACVGAPLARLEIAKLSTSSLIDYPGCALRMRTSGCAIQKA